MTLMYELFRRSILVKTSLYQICQHEKPSDCSLFGNMEIERADTMEKT